jgi:predicted 3-demethylubiquinone-9 3-methyltransferase (glyoxalase superfamily)
MSAITPCLWFDGKAEEAANFYASFPTAMWTSSIALRVTTRPARQAMC